jgi:hypothetical protein
LKASGRASSYLFGARARVQRGLSIDDPRWRGPALDMAQMPTERMGPPPGASPPMRMTASWSGSERTYRIQVCGVKLRRNGELPSDLYEDIRQPSQTPELRRNALSLFIVPPRAQASRRCETQATLSGKPPALLAFRSLDPFRALREPDRRRRDEERPSPLRTKNSQQNPNKQSAIKCPTARKSPLTGESPIQVGCEPVKQAEVGRIHGRLGLDLQVREGAPAVCGS